MHELRDVSRGRGQAISWCQYGWIADGASVSLAPPLPVSSPSMQVARAATAATTSRWRRSLEPEPSATAAPGRRVRPASPCARLPHTDDCTRRPPAGDHGGAVSSLDFPTRLCPSCTGTKHILLSLLAVHTARPRHTSDHCPLCAHRPLAPSPRPSLRPAQSLPDGMKKHQG